MPKSLIAKRKRMARYTYNPTRAATHITQHPLTVVEFNGGTFTGFEALFRSYYHIGTYTWTHTNTNALAAVILRLAHLHQQYPNHLPTTALLQWHVLSPTNTNSITLEVILANVLGEIDIVIASLSDIYRAKLTQPTIPPHEQTLINIVRLLHFLYNVQPMRIPYILATTSSAKLFSHTQHWLTPIITLDAPHAAR